MTRRKWLYTMVMGAIAIAVLRLNRTIPGFRFPCPHRWETGSMMRANWAFEDYRYCPVCRRAEWTTDARGPRRRPWASRAANVRANHTLPL